jgi:hypothetical protein
MPEGQPDIGAPPAEVVAIRDALAFPLNSRMVTSPGVLGDPSRCPILAGHCRSSFDGGAEPVELLSEENGGGHPEITYAPPACPICAKPVSGKRVYCSDACRKRAARASSLASRARGSRTSEQRDVCGDSEGV